MPYSSLSTNPKSRRLAADFSLIIVVFIWGVTFVAVKNALADIGVFTFIAIRFTIAFLFLAMICRQRLANIDRDYLKASAIIGLFLFAGYAFQTTGLRYTTASNAGFITGLSVALVPCFAAAVSRSLPDRATIIGVILAMSGLALLTLDAGLTLNNGDILVFCCAISFALHILSIGHFAPRTDANILATLQIGVTAVLSGIFAVGFETLPARLSGEVWTALAVTAIPATALAFLVQTTAQQFTTPSRTAVIFALEPAFAALAGIYLLDEVLTPWQLVGCALIICGTLASELLPDNRRS